MTDAGESLESRAALWDGVLDIKFRSSSNTKKVPRIHSWTDVSKPFFVHHKSVKITTVGEVTKFTDLARRKRKQESAWHTSVEEPITGLFSRKFLHT